MIQEFTRSVAEGHDLAMPQMIELMNLIVQGQCAESDVAEFLLALRKKGESVDELAGAAAALRQHMTPIQSSHHVLLDTCGTGGDGSGTFNISTAAALVTAAAGIPVAKHGNRSISSRSGSADVLAALGVNIEADLATVERCLEQLGICFCFAPLLHPSMKNVSAVRKRLGVPTIFNLLGPLCNPARAPFQLLGVGRPDLRDRVAAALAKLGTQRAAVLCGSDGLDEVTLAGPTAVSLVGDGPITTLSLDPSRFRYVAVPPHDAASRWARSQRRDHSPSLGRMPRPSPRHRHHELGRRDLGRARPDRSVPVISGVCGRRSTGD